MLAFIGVLLQVDLTYTFVGSVYTCINAASRPSIGSCCCYMLQPLYRVGVTAFISVDSGKHNGS